MATDIDAMRRERTARRAYEIWERDGRPPQRDLDHWLAAEDELRREDGPALDAGPGNPPVSNLERTMPPAERRAARARREGAGAGEAPAPEHFVVVADRAAVRIFAEEHPPGQREPRLRPLQQQAFPAGHQEYFERDTSPQGRFPGNGRHRGMSIDERLPAQREEERRLVALLGRTVGGFLRQYPDATWDFAAGPALHHALLDELEPAVRARLRRSVAKELANLPPPEILRHLASVAPPTL